MHHLSSRISSGMVLLKPRSRSRLSNLSSLAALPCTASGHRIDWEHRWDPEQGPLKLQPCVGVSSTLMLQKNQLSHAGTLLIPTVSRRTLAMLTHCHHSSCSDAPGSIQEHWDREPSPSRWDRQEQGIFLHPPRGHLSLGGRMDTGAGGSHVPLSGGLILGPLRCPQPCP